MSSLSVYRRGCGTTARISQREEKRSQEYLAHRAFGNIRRSDAGKDTKGKLWELQAQRSRLFPILHRAEWFTGTDLCLLQLRSQVGELNWKSVSIDALRERVTFRIRRLCKYNTKKTNLLAFVDHSCLNLCSANRFPSTYSRRIRRKVKIATVHLKNSVWFSIKI